MSKTNRFSCLKPDTNTDSKNMYKPNNRFLKKSTSKNSRFDSLKTNSDTDSKGRFNFTRNESKPTSNGRFSNLQYENKDRNRYDGDRNRRGGGDRYRRDGGDRYRRDDRGDRYRRDDGGDRGNRFKNRKYKHSSNRVGRMGDPSQWNKGSLDAFMKMNHKEEKKKVVKNEKPKILKLNRKNSKQVEELSQAEKKAEEEWNKQMILNMQYEWETESEEEEEETMLSTGLPNIPPSTDNSAW